MSFAPRRKPQPGHSLCPCLVHLADSCKFFQSDIIFWIFLSLYWQTFLPDLECNLIWIPFSLFPKLRIKTHCYWDTLSPFLLFGQQSTPLISWCLRHLFWIVPPSKQMHNIQNFAYSQTSALKMHFSVQMHDWLWLHRVTAKNAQKISEIWYFQPSSCQIPFTPRWHSYYPYPQLEWPRNNTKRALLPGK